MAGKRFNKRKALLLLLAALATIIVLPVGYVAACDLLVREILCPPSIQLNEKILDYCETHEEIRLSDVTDFDWDVAYVDPEPYGKGERLKERYHIEGKLRELGGTTRIAFCKDGRVVFDFSHISADSCRLWFDSSVEVIYPDSVFEAEWITMLFQSGEYLHLTPKQEQDAAPLSGDASTRED
ncbi:MAG: hypothetical protein FWE94_04840 [Coriobacteriia bacterium]|nr:hypothetical protein [Coriobacteriia bacterium]